MEIQQLAVLLRLVLAHLLADFILQTNRIVQGKKEGFRSKYFYLHIFLVGITTYILLADWKNWWAPLMIMIMHGLIDWTKIQFRQNMLWLFLVDQLLHMLSLIGLWLLLTNNTICSLFKILLHTAISDKMLVIVIGYALITVPVGVLIAYITYPWSKELDTNGSDSLTNAGRWIGIIERILILTFILNKQWAPIGFLLAAKSVFRFGDLREGKDRKRTEYIVIGTFLSFTFSILLGILVLFVLDQVK